MKNILLSVVVVTTLVAAGVGGTLADFSDIETSQDNYFETGGMDLKVSDDLGNEYDDPDIPTFYEVTTGWPCCSKDRTFDLHNAGDGEQSPPHVYIHIKNLECSQLEPKITYKYIKCDPADPSLCIETDAADPDGRPVTEPEYVACCGGVAGEDKDGNPVTVPGIGCDVCTSECLLSHHIDITIKTSAAQGGPWTEVDLFALGLDKNKDGFIKMNEVECEQIELGTLPGCTTMWVNTSLHLQNIDEDDLGLHCFDENDDDEKKWDHWPSNALMYDRMDFDMAFELFQK